MRPQAESCRPQAVCLVYSAPSRGSIRRVTRSNCPQSIVIPTPTARASGGLPGANYCLPCRPFAAHAPHCLDLLRPSALPGQRVACSLGAAAAARLRRKTWRGELPLNPIRRAGRSNVPIAPMLSAIPDVFSPRPKMPTPTRNVHAPRMDETNLFLLNLPPKFTLGVPEREILDSV